MTRPALFVSCCSKHTNLNYSMLMLQGGDCFDMCTVLCSLLLGAGFDAYVVTGYAPTSVTVNDQTSAVCPLLVPEVVKPQKIAPMQTQVSFTLMQTEKTPRPKRSNQATEAKYKIKSGVRAESVRPDKRVPGSGGCFRVWTAQEDSLQT